MKIGHDSFAVLCILLLLSVVWASVQTWRLVSLHTPCAESMGYGEGTCAPGQRVELTHSERPCGYTSHEHGWICRCPMDGGTR